MTDGTQHRCTGPKCPASEHDNPKAPTVEELQRELVVVGMFLHNKDYPADAGEIADLRICVGVLARAVRAQAEGMPQVEFCVAHSCTTYDCTRKGLIECEPVPLSRNIYAGLGDDDDEGN